MITMQSQKPTNKTLRVKDDEQLLGQSDQLKLEDGESVTAEMPLDLGLDR